MTIWSKSLCCTGVLAILLIHPVWTDEIIMKNGDRLQGTVTSMASGKLNFETEYAGKITIDWDHVVRLSTEGLIQFTLNDERILTGSIVMTEEGSLVVRPESGFPTEAIPLDQIKKLDVPAPDRWEFDIYLTVGLSHASGNTNTEKYNLDGEVKFSHPSHTITLFGEAHLERDNGRLSKDKDLFSLNYRYFHTPTWYLFASSWAQRDEFKDLNYLASFTSGIGHWFWKSDRKNLSIGLGPSYTFEMYNTPMQNFGNSSRRDYFGLSWGFDFDVWFFNQALELFYRNFGVMSLEDRDVWQIINRTGVRVPLWLKMFGSLAFNYDYVNSPADNKKKEDRKFDLKLGIEW